MKSVLVTFVVACWAFSEQVLAYTNAPIIGVFSLPTQTGQENIIASYVKFLELAGAQVVRVPYKASDAEIDLLAASLNGFFLTGGETGMTRAVHRALDKSRAIHAAGGWLPVWGTCLGFEWLLEHVADGCLQSGFDAKNYSVPVELAEDVVVRSSRMLGSAPAALIDALTKHNSTYNEHRRGAEPGQWARFPALAETFQVLSTNKDRRGRPFVSMIEAKGSLPWFGVQFHPEKVAFERGLDADGTQHETIPHSAEALMIMQHLANFFVGQTRRSSQSLSSQEMQQRMLYGRPVTTQYAPHYLETYLFSSPIGETLPEVIVLD